MISKTSKEKFVKSKSSEEKSKIFEKFMRPYSQNPGNGLDNNFISNKFRWLPT